MMVLLESRLLYLFSEVGIVPLVDNGNARPLRHFAEFIRRQHFQALIDRCHAETAVIAYPRFTLHSFLGRYLDDAGCTTRTVLRRFGSIISGSLPLVSEVVPRRRTASKAAVPLAARCMVRPGTLP